MNNKAPVVFARFTHESTSNEDRYKQQRTEVEHYLAAMFNKGYKLTGFSTCSYDDSSGGVTYARGVITSFVLTLS